MSLKGAEREKRQKEIKVAWAKDVKSAPKDKQVKGPTKSK